MKNLKEENENLLHKTKYMTHKFISFQFNQLYSDEIKSQFWQNGVSMSLFHEFSKGVQAGEECQDIESIKEKLKDILQKSRHVYEKRRNEATKQNYCKSKSIAYIDLHEYEYEHLGD